MSLFDSASLVVTPNGTKASKLYAIKPTDGSGDLVVTRATTATRVNSSGLIESVATNVPRLDYTNLSCPSILIEPQRTNLVTYSEQFDNAAWGKSGVSVTANQTTGPDGTASADLVTTTNATSHELLQSKIATGVHTCSFYVKKNNSQTFYINMYPNGWTAYFNLNNGTVSSVVGSGVTANVTNAGNGWYRCSMTFTSVGSEIQLGFLDTVYTGVAGNPWTISTSVGTSGYVWGAQLEAGSYATSYIPTVASSVTRNADVISKTGISSLIGQTEGTLFMDCKINALPVDGSLFGIQKNASNFVIRCGSQGTNIYAQSYNGSANLFFEATPYTLGSRVKAAFAYKAGSYAFYVNGIQIAIGSNATTIPTCDETMFNSLWGNFNDSLSFYSAAALWKTRLSNTELATLTTI